MQRKYTEAEKSAALVAYDLSGGNMSGTAKRIGIPRKTLESWVTGRAGTNDAVAAMRQEKRRSIADLLEDEVYAILNLLPEKRTEAHYRDLLVSLGIATDKMQLLRGEDTERSNVKIHVTYGDDEDSGEE